MTICEIQLSIRGHHDKKKGKKKKRKKKEEGENMNATADDHRSLHASSIILHNPHRLLRG